MITNQKKAVLALSGARYPAAALVQQAGLTLGLAALVGEKLAALMPPGFLDETGTLRDEVDKLRQDKTVTADEALQATNAQHKAVREIKDWRRQVVSRCLRGVHAGLTVPELLTQMGNPRGVPEVMELLSKTIALLNDNALELASLGPQVTPLIEVGRKLYQDLDQAENAQEKARAAQLPDSTSAFNAKKGELYAALKIINEAAHELYAKDPEASARFNLSLLHGRNKSPSSPEPTPTPPAPTPPSPPAAAATT
jgi:hypothetical protein